MPQERVVLHEPRKAGLVQRREQLAALAERVLADLMLEQHQHAHKERNNGDVRHAPRAHGEAGGGQARLERGERVDEHDGVRGGEEDAPATIPAVLPVSGTALDDGRDVAGNVLVDNAPKDIGELRQLLLQWRC